MRLLSRDICWYFLGYLSGSLVACAGLLLVVELFAAIDTWLLSESRVVDVPMAYNLTFVMLSSLKPLCFHSLKHELCFSVNAGA